MILQNEGRFRGFATNYGVAEHGENKVLQFSAEFHLIEMWDAGAWAPLPEPCQITGFFYLTKKDGSLNASTIDKLKAAFGWNGADPFWLQDNDLTQTLVQVTTKFEEYNGKTKLKIAWLDSADAAPSIVKRSDEADRRRILANVGAKFRANAGGVPANPPLPSRSAPPAMPSRPAPGPAGSMESAWAEFERCYKGKAGERDDRWWDILREQFPGKLVPQDITPQEWGKLASDMAELVEIPF